MNAYQLKFWPAVKPDLDIKSEHSDLFADMSPFAAVVRQDPNCKPQDRDPGLFFNATYLTAELKQLFKDVLGGLSGAADRIFALTGDRDFSQTFLCLYHLTKHRQELPQIPQFFHLPNPESIQVAGLTGFDLEIETGIEVEPGFSIFTPWGYLAWQLGGSFAYSLIKIHDEQRVAPSQYLLRQLMGDRPTLILLENFLEYVHRAIEVLGTEDPFLPQILTFLQNLISVTEDVANTVLVYSLPANQSSLLTVVESLVNATHPVETRNKRSLHSHEINSENEIAPEKESTPETKKAIAVVNLDEQTYYSRSVSAPKCRKTKVTKIWASKCDRFSNQLANCLVPNFKSIVRKQTTPEMGDRIPVKIQSIANPVSDRLRKYTAVPFFYRDSGTIADIPTLYQAQKLSEIDLVFKELMARSPPK